MAQVCVILRNWKAKRKTEEPDTVILYVRFCEGIGGAIRYSISITYNSPAFVHGWHKRNNIDNLENKKDKEELN